MKKPKVKTSGGTDGALERLRKKAKKENGKLIFHGDPQKVPGVGQYMAGKLKKQGSLKSVGRGQWEIVDQSAPAEVPATTAKGTKITADPSNDDSADNKPGAREIELFDELFLDENGGTKSPTDIRRAQAMILKLNDLGKDLLSAHDALARLTEYTPFRKPKRA